MSAVVVAALGNINLALVVEDDPQVRVLLCQLLAGEGYEVSAASNCPDARQVIKDHKPSLVLLDLGLPGGDGLDLGQWIRSTSPGTGIIILTGRSDVETRIIGLKNCADDYVVKPFDVQEVSARIHSLMRRLAAPGPSNQDDGLEMAFEGGQLSESRCSLTVNGLEVRLTAMEFRLLKALVSRKGKIANREWLLDRIKADIDINERTVDYHVCTLRLKLRKAGIPDDVIVSVRGMGYRYG